MSDCQRTPTYAKPSCEVLRSNDFRNRIDRLFQSLLCRNDLGVTACDGMEEDNIGLINALIKADEHFKNTSGGMHVAIETTPPRVPSCHCGLRGCLSCRR